MLRAIRFLLASGVVMAAMAVAPMVLAQPDTKPKAPPGFEPLPGAEQRAESVSASSLVVGAYASILVLMCGFVMFVVRSQSAISKEIAELSSKIDRETKG